MGLFWRQWLLFASIITYAALCIVFAEFANGPMPIASPAGPLMSQVSQVTQVKAPEPVKIKRGGM
jgi:hypothetical protein